jgi:hypothetical protein
VVSKQTKSVLDKLLILFIKTLIKNESKYPLFQYNTVLARKKGERQICSCERQRGIYGQWMQITK